MPGRRHQEAVRHLPEYKNDCGGHSYPDLTVFCREPEEEGLVTLIPEAVIEIVSPRYETKDLVMGVPFYLAQGVKDVIVFDPRTLAIVYARRDGSRTLISRAVIELQCGCVCEV